MPGSVLGHGVCPADLVRVVARHRGQPACTGHAALADLCRLGPTSHRHSPAAVCARAFGRRVGCDGLRFRCNDHRPVFVGVPLDAVSLDQGRCQVAHAAGLARRDSYLNPHHRRQDPRGQCAGRSADRTGCVLPDGPGLSGFLPAVCHSRGASFLCDPEQRATPSSSGATRTQWTAPTPRCCAVRPAC